MFVTTDDLTFLPGVSAGQVITAENPSSRSRFHIVTNFITRKQVDFLKFNKNFTLYLLTPLNRQFSLLIPEGKLLVAATEFLQRVMIPLKTLTKGQIIVKPVLDQHGLKDPPSLKQDITPEAA